MRTALAANFLVISSACGAFGQPAEPAPSFEVASVKACPSSEAMRERPNVTTDPGNVTMMNLPLKAVIQWAYHVQAVQVIGPGWLDSTRFNINAKAAGPSSDEKLRLMMQTLLADRFKLAFHRETKEMSAYVVSVAKGGHKLKPSEGDGPMDAKPTGKGLNIAFTHVTLAELAEMAGSPLQAVVVDQTGLKGAWDFTIDASTFAMQRPADLEDAISMMIQMMNDQLGIKVEQKRVPAEVLIVDHIEKMPVEN